MTGLAARDAEDGAGRGAVCDVPAPPHPDATDASATNPHPTPHRIAASLERERALDPAAARTRQLRLTTAGRALVASALAAVEATDEDYFAAIGEGRDAFLDALGTLCAGG